MTEDDSMQILLLPSDQNQDLVNISTGGQLADDIVLDKGFRTPAEVGNARAIGGHLITNTVPVDFISEEHRLQPSFIQNLPEGPKEHYAAVSGLR